MWLRRNVRTSSGDIDDELRAHIELETEENIERGMPPAEARRRALLKFGNSALVKEDCRAVWHRRLLDDLVQDVRYALRTFRRSPTFVAVAILSLALGIGANTAIFSLMNAVMLRLLPVRDPQQLVHLYVRNQYGRESFSHPLFRDVQKRTDLFDSVMGARGVEPANVSLPPGSRRERVRMNLVSGNFFSGLGVRAVLGRMLDPEDDRVSGANPVAVVSYAWWKSRFGGSPAVLGETFELNRKLFTVVGVAQAGFRGVAVEEPVDVWMPLSAQPAIFGNSQENLEFRNWTWIEVLARLKPGVTRAQAEAVVDSMFQADLAAQTRPVTDGARRRRILDQRVQLEAAANGLSALREPASAPLRLLMGIVAVLLLIACANVANLMLARGAARAREITTRLAIGAGRMRLLRQLLTESLLLSLAGGVAGLLLALWGSRLLAGLLTARAAPVQLDLSLDPNVLAFTAGVSILTGLVFGIVPALRAVKIDLAPSLKDNTLASVGSGHSRLSKALVVAQVMMCVILLVGGSLFARSLHNLLSEDMGFARQNVLLVWLDSRLTGYDFGRLRQTNEQMLDRIRALPGVRAAGLAAHPFSTGASSQCCISVAGYTPQPAEDRSVRSEVATPGYLAAMGIPIVRGRDFSSSDGPETRNVAIINETMARRYFGNADPVGRSFWWGDNPRKSSTFEIIGVAKDARYSRIREPATRMIYFAASQRTGVESLVVRTAGPPEAAAETIRRTIERLEPNMQVMQTTTLENLVNGSLAEERALALLSALFALLALLLASVGLYGLMAYSVHRRTREIGIRMALGADRGQTLRLVLREAMLLVGVGLIAGLPASAMAARLFATRLYGLSPTDPVTIGAAGAILLLVAGFAGFLPARRASRIDPMAALRCE